MGVGGSECGIPKTNIVIGTCSFNKLGPTSLKIAWGLSREFSAVFLEADAGARLQGERECGLALLASDGVDATESVDAPSPRLQIHLHHLSIANMWVRPPFASLCRQLASRGSLRKPVPLKASWLRPSQSRCISSGKRVSCDFFFHQL